MKWALGIAAALLLAALGFVAYGTRQDAIAPAQQEAAATTTPAAPGLSYANATNDDIVVDAPTPASLLGQSVTVTGKARGTWYFEATFPAKLVAADGTTLTQVPAQAQGDWMTADFVPFAVTLDAGGYAGAATVVLSRDNPSGLPSADASVSFPVTIGGGGTSSAATTTGAGE